MLSNPIHLFTHYYPFIAMIISISLSTIYHNTHLFFLFIGIIFTGYLNYLLKNYIALPIGN